MSTFEKELGQLLNSYSRENASNTPDFILARYIAGCLRAFEAAVLRREEWYGRDPHRGPASAVESGEVTANDAPCRFCGAQVLAFHDSDCPLVVNLGWDR